MGEWEKGREGEDQQKVHHGAGDLRRPLGDCRVRPAGGEGLWHLPTNSHPSWALLGVGD